MGERQACLLLFEKNKNRGFLCVAKGCRDRNYIDDVITLRQTEYKDSFLKDIAEHMSLADRGVRHSSSVLGATDLQVEHSRVCMHAHTVPLTFHSGTF